MNWRYGKMNAINIGNPRPRLPNFVTGRVKKHNKNGTIQVDSIGNLYPYALIVPRGWAYENDEKQLVADINLPPIDSLVFCALDHNGACIVLSGWTMQLEDSYKKLLTENDNEKVTSRWPAGWFRIFNRITGNLELLDETDKKAKIIVNKEEQTIEISDFNENNIILNKEKIIIKSNSKIEVKTAEDTKIASDGKILIDSKIELNGNSKELVTHKELKKAINAVLKIIEDHTHVVTPVGAGKSDKSLTLENFKIEMDNAKAKNIKTG